MRLLLLFATVVLYMVAAEKCYMYGTLSSDCKSDEGKTQHVRADSGPPGKNGEKGKPCVSSTVEYETMKKTLQSANNNNKKQFQETLKLVDKLQQTYAKAINSEHSTSSDGGSGYTDSKKITFKNIRYQYFNYQANKVGAEQMCQEKGGQLAFANLLTPAERKKVFKKLNLNPKTPIWLNAKVYPYGKGAIWFGGSSRLQPVYVWENNVHRFFGLPATSQYWNKIVRQKYKPYPCLICKQKRCKVVSCYKKTASVVCQYPFTTPAGPVKQIIAFKTKLNFYKSRSLCQELGGELGFKFMKTKDVMRKFILDYFNGKINGGSHNYDREFWIGGMTVDGTSNMYKYLDGTSIGDINKFPWLRPRYPGTATYTAQKWFYTNPDGSSKRYDKFTLRKNVLLNSSLRGCLVLKVKINHRKKTVDYGVKSVRCSNQKRWFFCEFTKPFGNHYHTYLTSQYTSLTMSRYQNL